MGGGWGGFGVGVEVYVAGLEDVPGWVPILYTLEILLAHSGGIDRTVYFHVASMFGIELGCEFGDPE